MKTVAWRGQAKVTQPEEVEASHVVVLPLQGPETESPQARFLDQLTTYPGCLNHELRKMKRKEQIRSSDVFQAPRFPASPQLDLKACNPSMWLHRAHFPSPPCISVSHFLKFLPRLLFLLEEKVFFTVIYVCLCRSLVEVFQRVSELFFV